MNKTYNGDAMAYTSTSQTRTEAVSNPSKRGYLYNASPGRIHPNRGLN
jgi:hypothetical protein